MRRTSKQERLHSFAVLTYVYNSLLMIYYGWLLTIHLCFLFLENMQLPTVLYLLYGTLDWF
jgi:hypothetical protein